MWSQPCPGQSGGDRRPFVRLTLCLASWTEAREHSRFLESHKSEPWPSGSFLYLFQELSHPVTVIPSDCLEAWIRQESLCTNVSKPKSLHGCSDIFRFTLLPIEILKTLKNKKSARVGSTPVCLSLFSERINWDRKYFVWESLWSWRPASHLEFSILTSVPCFAGQSQFDNNKPRMKYICLFSLDCSNN